LNTSFRKALLNSAPRRTHICTNRYTRHYFSNKHSASNRTRINSPRRPYY